MKCETPFKFSPHSHRKLNGGVQYRYYFENGYGLSVVQHWGSYGYDDDLWEIGLVEDNQLIEHPDWGDQVKGYLAIRDVNQWLDIIGTAPTGSLGLAAHQNQHREDD